MKAFCAARNATTTTGAPMVSAATVISPRSATYRLRPVGGGGQNGFSGASVSPARMGTYTALIEVKESHVQNAQELAAVWGDIRSDLDAIGELKEAYAILGEHDFLVLFEAQDRGEALQMSLSMERYGLDTQTMELIPIDQFGELVEDF